MISFELKLRNIVFFEVQQGFNSELKSEILKLEGTTYKLICSSSRNSYQKSSTLDKEIKEKLIRNGSKSIHPCFPSCPINIKYDLALTVGDKKVIFEVEKANKEKILYDYLKAHIYMDFEIDKVVIMAPLNWVHSLGINNLYDIAKQRLDLCRIYQMGSKEKLKNILIVGFTQEINGIPLDKKTLEMINQECISHFSKK